MPGKPGQGFDIEGGSAPTAPSRTQWLVSSHSESERSIVSIAKVRNPVAVVAGRHYSLTKASASLNDRYAPPFGQALTAISGLSSRTPKLIRLRHSRGLRTDLSAPRAHDPFDVLPHGYRITSSARRSSDCGIVRPSAFAVLRLMTSSNIVGRTTGKSAGLSPLRIRPA